MIIWAKESHEYPYLTLDIRDKNEKYQNIFEYVKA